MDIPTEFDDDREEIEELMLRFYPDYLSEIGNGQYQVAERTAQSLRNIFSLAAIRSYFYETIPSLANPLGIGTRSNAHRRQGAEPADRRLPGLPGHPPRVVPLHVGRKR